MNDDFDGIGWREYMRGIENGNIDPTGERLRAICRLAREDHNAMVSLVQTLLDNDPDEPIADNGMTVLDGWREQAKRLLGAVSGAGDTNGEGR